MRDDVIHLWHGQPKKFDFDQVQLHLAPNEIERAQRFRFREDRDAFALVHAMRRIELSHILGAQPQELEFGRSQKGRPTLQNAHPKDLAFSASRRRKLVIFAAAGLSRLGVDVEQIGPVDNPASLLAKFLSDESLSALSIGTVRERSHAFAKLWTITEACAKARGTGLETFTPRMTVLFETSDLAIVEDGPNRWRCQIFAADPEHFVTVAYAAPQWLTIRLTKWAGLPG